MSIKTPRLIRDRCGVYYFRLVVPLALRKAVGKVEFRRSLRTKDAATARQRALTLCVAVEEIMAGPKVSDFSHLFGDDSRVRKAITADIERGIFHADTPEEAALLPKIIEAGVAARTALQSHNLAAAMPVSKSGKTLQQASDLFFKERAPTLKDSTLTKHRGAVKAFIEKTGNIDLGMVTSQNMVDYKQGMLADGRAASTVNDHISILRGYFDFCINNKLARIDNPAGGMSVKGARNQTESYEPFTPEELRTIFKPSVYLKRMKKTPDFYWGPILGLFTGARLEEIASLELTQVRTEEDVSFIHILDGKNDNAVRKVVLHDELLKLGFLDYVETMRQAGYKMLFPHLVDGKNGYGKNLGRIFGKYLDTPEVNIIHPLKVFHSLRHTAITRLTEAEANTDLKRMLVGHEHDKPYVVDVHQFYIHGEVIAMQSLKRTMNLLRYKGLDIQALKVPPDAFLRIVASRVKSAKNRAKKVPAEKKSKEALPPSPAR